MMMMYPEEPIWAIPPIPGLEDDGDYRGKRSFIFFFSFHFFFHNKTNNFLWVENFSFKSFFIFFQSKILPTKKCLQKKNSSDEWTRQGLQSN